MSTPEQEMFMRASNHSARSEEAANGAVSALYAGMDFWRTFALGVPVTMTIETMRFLGRRLQADAEHLAALNGCRSLEDYVKLQSGFVSKSVSDYQEEAVNLSKDVQEAVYPRAA